MPPKNQFKLPREILSEAEIAKRAEATRLKYADKDRLPVPIDEIVEFGLQINIVTGATCKQMSGDEVDGYLTPDLQEIVVYYESLLHFPSRARFTLAHECGHKILHPTVYSDVAGKLENIAAYRNLMLNLDQTELGWIEYQANCFAGHILVPSHHLQREFQTAYQSLGTGAVIDQGNFEAIIAKLEPVFDVSASVLRIRCTKEGLAPKPVID